MEKKNDKKKTKEEVFFTISGVRHYLGTEFMKEGMEVKLVKEPDNEYDKEAIRVEMRGAGKVGYVGNSVNTVMGESMSAGRSYDRIGDTASGVILLVTPNWAICELVKGEK